jgi:hypothetical protein
LNPSKRWIEKTIVDFKIEGFERKTTKKRYTVIWRAISYLLEARIPQSHFPANPCRKSTNQRTKTSRSPASRRNYKEEAPPMTPRRFFRRRRLRHEQVAQTVWEKEGWRASMRPWRSWGWEKPELRTRWDFFLRRTIANNLNPLVGANRTSEISRPTVNQQQIGFHPSNSEFKISLPGSGWIPPVLDATNWASTQSLWHTRRRSWPRTIKLSTIKKSWRYRLRAQLRT